MVEPSDFTTPVESVTPTENDGQQPDHVVEPEDPTEDPVFEQLLLATLSVSPDNTKKLEDDPRVKAFIARNPAKNLRAIQRLEALLRSTRRGSGG